MTLIRTWNRVGLVDSLRAGIRRAHRSEHARNRERKCQGMGVGGREGGREGHNPLLFFSFLFLFPFFSGGGGTARTFRWPEVAARMQGCKAGVQDVLLHQPLVLLALRDVSLDRPRIHLGATAAPCRRAPGRGGP